MPKFKLTPYKHNKKAREQNWQCIECKKMLDGLFHIDHRIPKCEGGTNEWSNLAAICPMCHIKKSEREMERFTDRRREQTLHRSKYWEIGSSYYLSSPHLSPPPPYIARHIHQLPTKLL